jgi:hypothetical protein
MVTHDINGSTSSSKKKSLPLPVLCDNKESDKKSGLLGKARAEHGHDSNMIWRFQSHGISSKIMAISMTRLIELDAGLASGQYSSAAAKDSNPG